LNTIYSENTDNDFIYTHLKIESPKVDFHLHDGYEIFFLVSGDVNYFVEKKIYPIKYGDLIITNNHEIHKPSFQSKNIYERICLEFNPELIRPFSSTSFNLSNCFINRENGEQNKLSLSHQQLKDVLGYFNKIQSLCDDTQDGNEILKLNTLIELLVYLNRIFMNVPPNYGITNIPGKLIPILDFIDNNLEGDLRLKALEKKFYIDRFYLSKLFKKSLGSNIHNYIIFKRISRAKKLLSEGLNVTDTCIKCGFNDYSNFLKMFKNTVKVSPGKYIKK